MTVDQVRSALRQRIARGATFEELETFVSMTRGIGERQRTALLGDAWRYDPRRATNRRVAGVRSLLGRVSARATRGGRVAANRAARPSAVPRTARVP